MNKFLLLIIYFIFILNFIFFLYFSIPLEKKNIDKTSLKNEKKNSFFFLNK